MTRPCLVLVTTSFPRRGDGSEAAGAFVADLAATLARRARVRVVAPGEATRTEVWNDGVEVFRYAAPTQPLSTLRPWRPRDAVQLARVLSEGASATRLAAAGATHLVALWALPCGAWARAAARRQGIDYSVWTLGSDVWTLGRVPGLRGLLRRVLRGARHAWSDGLRLAEDTARIGGRPVAFLPSTRDLGEEAVAARAGAAPWRLLFLGRWHPNKGIDLLLEALSRLDEDAWARIGEVRIEGGGPLVDGVRAGVQALAAAGRPVRLGAFLDKAASVAAIRAADWLLVPSRIESIPLVFSDAVKLGCPVIAMPVGDLAALVSDAPACGVVAASVDAPAFAGALAQALRDGPARYAPGVQDRAARFDLESVARRLRDGCLGGGDA